MTTNTPWNGRSDIEAHLKLFATLNSMGLIEKYQSVVMKALSSGMELRDPKSLFDWVAKQGIDASKFKAIYNSFGMQSQINKANEITTAYAVENVPLFVVDGNFATSPNVEAHRHDN